MFSVRNTLLFLGLLGGSIFSSPTFASFTYIPAPIISMTGANSEVFFDITDDIFLSGTSIPGPRFDTISGTFSGAFYLSGAGWVDFSTGSYVVSLDCGVETYASLTLPCTLSGVAYSEMIGDIVFDRRVSFFPDSGTLSGDIMTLIGDYSLSGIYLPLLPAFFTEGTGSVAHHSTALSISGGTDRYGDGVWKVYFDESTTSDSYTPPAGITDIDLSLAATYQTRIIDPHGSVTRSSYIVTPDLPDTSLFPASTRRELFCTTHPTSTLCPEGVVLSPSRLDSSPGSKVADGVDRYDFSLRLRDRYGNEVKEGSVRVEYKDTLRNIQVSPLEYMNDMTMSGLALITKGVLLNNYDGTLTSTDIPVTGGFSYSIASTAPTTPIDTVSLSGVIYRDKNNIEHSLAPPGGKTSLVFTPWYHTSLSATPIIVGEESRFTTTFSSVNTQSAPPDLTAIYQIDIGDNKFASYKDYTPPHSCTKYVSVIGSDECNWFIFPDDTSIISTSALMFSGTYTSGGGYDLAPENVSYRSYIRYMTGGVVVVYPSNSGNLGVALPGLEYMKILGAHNIEGSQSAIGVNGTNIWNMLRKNVALLSRSRTDYSDVNYTVYTGNQSFNDNDIGTKRTLVVIGGDITLTSDISQRNSSIALIALSDSDGNGGEIIIDPSVRDISASLYAEKVIRSSGDNQLYIHGSVISHNTVSSSKCPYYVSGVCDPALYNLQKIREDYLDLADKTGHTATSPRALEHTDVSVIIEHDGRTLSDPPPLLEK